jgi:hypothetical protein
LDGHLVDVANRTSDDGKPLWELHIDTIAQAPLDATFDPPSSFYWPKPSSSPNDSRKLSTNLRGDAEACALAIRNTNYDAIAESCGKSASDFRYIAMNPGPRGEPRDVASLLILSAASLKARSYGLLRLRRTSESRAAFENGKGTLEAVRDTPGCHWCAEAARAALQSYGNWPPKSPHLVDY